MNRTPRNDPRNHVGQQPSSDDVSRHTASWFDAVASTPLLIAALFAIAHLVLIFAVDVADPGTFLRADRAHERYQTLLGLLAALQSHAVPSDLVSNPVSYLATHGIVGDYAAHALLYAIGGRFAVIAAQIALALAAAMAVFRLAVLLQLSRSMCAIAMIAYLCSPHALVFPHQLATEALHVPLFVLSVWLLVEGIGRNRRRMLIASALCLGLATLIRPITLLWPCIAVAALLIAKPAREGLVYLCVALLPLIAWMSFIGAQTGTFGLGKSDHSMERNLYERVARIADTLPPAERSATNAAYLLNAEKTLGPIDYLRFSVEYPAASMRHVARDAIAFFAKSGVERLTIDYLAVSSNAAQVQAAGKGWRRHFESYGAASTLRYLWESLGPALLVSVAGAAVTAALFVLAFVASIHFVRRWREIRTVAVLTGLLLVTSIVYFFVFSQVLNAMQSRQRAPAEFALVLLAAAGAEIWRRSRNRRHSNAASVTGKQLAVSS